MCEVNGCAVAAWLAVCWNRKLFSSFKTTLKWIEDLLPSLSYPIHLWWVLVVPLSRTLIWMTKQSMSASVRISTSIFSCGCKSYMELQFLILFDSDNTWRETFDCWLAIGRKWTTSVLTGLRSRSRKNSRTSTWSAHCLQRERHLHFQRGLHIVMPLTSASLKRSYLLTHSLHRWSEWLTFPIKYQDLPLSTQAVFTIWNIVAPHKKAPGNQIS